MVGLTLASVFLHVLHVTLILGVKSGPFKSSYTRVEPCPNPTLPLDSDPDVILFVELYNTTKDTNLLRVKVNVVRDHKLKKLRAKSYLWDNNRWKINYVMNNMGCSRAFIPLLMEINGVKYDSQTCTYLKGVYTFDELNVDKIQHLWMKTQDYGRVMWKIEAFSFTETVYYCWEFETLIVPV